MLNINQKKLPGKADTVEDMPYINPVDAALARRPPQGGRRLSLAVCVLLLVLTIWAGLAELDEVIHADGHVIASQRTQTLQNLEGGILRAILVRENQIVEKGTPLARLDNEMAESSYRDAVQRATDHQAAIIRLDAELAGKQPVFPDEMRSKAPQVIADQMATYEARLQQNASEMSLLESQFQQRRQDVEEQISRKKNLDKSLAIAIEQRNIAAPLMQRRNYSRVDFLGLEQRVVQLQGEVESLASSLPKTQAAMEEARQRMVFRKAELDSAATEEINKRRAELNSLQQTISAGGDRVTRTEVRAPVRGTVKQIYIHTVGGVIKPGEPIMDIVPLNDNLLIEARVRPSDVAFLRPGQKAMIKFSAYDFSIYGGLPGRVEQISADTLEDKRGEFYYRVKIRTQDSTITYKGEQLPVIPGMVCTADILTGKKTVLDFLLKPILKAKQNALRER